MGCSLPRCVAGCLGLGLVGYLARGAGSLTGSLTVCDSLSASLLSTSCQLQHDYTFDEVSAKSAAGAKLCRLLRLRPLTNLLNSTGVNSSRGLLLITLVSKAVVCVGDSIHMCA